MSASTDLASTSPTAQKLAYYLAADPAARRTWQSQARRHRSGSLNQAAIAHVLARWMWEHGEASDIDTQLPRRLKDKVSRALSGEYLPPQTLRIFIEAFEIHDELAQELWDLHFRS